MTASFYGIVSSFIMCGTETVLLGDQLHSYCRQFQRPMNVIRTTDKACNSTLYVTEEEALKKISSYKFPHTDKYIKGKCYDLTVLVYHSDGLKKYMACKKRKGAFGHIVVSDEPTESTQANLKRHFTITRLH